MKKLLVAVLIVCSCGGSEVVEEPLTTTTTAPKETTTTSSSTTTTTISEERQYRGIFPWDGDWDSDLGKKGAIQQVTLPVEKGLIKTIDISPQDTFREYVIIYPQIVEHSSQTCYETINKEIENTVTLYVESDLETEPFRKKVKEEEYDAEGRGFFDWLYLEYEIIEASDEVFSAFFYWDSYGAGAAHPVSNPFSINYDITNCQKINFDEFFDETILAGFEQYSAYKQKIELEILKQLCAEDGIPNADDCEYREMIRDYFEWRFGEERSEKWNIFDSSTTSFGVGQYGIFVQFWEYDFYYATGEELILLPWYDLSRYLDPNSIYSTILEIYSERDELATVYEPEWDY